MSQATSINQEKPSEYQGLRLPLDPIIEFTANQVATRFDRVKEREVVRFLRFSCVGILGAMLDLGISLTLFQTVFPPLDVDGSELFWNYTIATTISFAAAITSNFFWNRYWTYPDSRSRSLGAQLLLFAFICTVGWLARGVWLDFAIEPAGQWMRENTGLETGLANSLGAVSAVLVAIFIVMIWNFVVNRLWTFNDVE
ncbi:MAG: GtrA family protein [Chloroflexota bacterium]